MEQMASEGMRILESDNACHQRSRCCPTRAVTAFGTCSPEDRRTVSGSLEMRLEEHLKAGRFSEEKSPDGAPGEIHRQKIEAHLAESNPRFAGPGPSPDGKAPEALRHRTPTAYHHLRQASGQGAPG